MNASKQQESEQPRCKDCGEPFGRLSDDCPASIRAMLEAVDICATCCHIRLIARSATPATLSADEEIETPRTDAVAVDLHPGDSMYSYEYVPADHARALERELAAYAKERQARIELVQSLSLSGGIQREQMLKDRQALILREGELLAQLSAIQAELATVQRERDLAIAHDRQPYPTAHAYEAACAALNKHREEADALRSQLTEAQKLISDNHLVIEGLGDDLKEANAKLADRETQIADMENQWRRTDQAKEIERDNLKSDKYELEAALATTEGERDELQRRYDEAYAAYIDRDRKLISYAREIDHLKQLLSEARSPHE